MLERDLIVKALIEVEAAEGAGRPVDREGLARRLGVSPGCIEEALLVAVGAGLCLLEEQQALPEPPVLLRAGRQFLSGDCPADDPALGFLPRLIDDLHARSALLEAGRVVTDLFRRAILGGSAVEWARDIVPPAFVEAIDDCDALDLYAATVALLARLSAGRPAGCVGEEIVAVDLMTWARLILDEAVNRGDLTSEDALHAAREMDNLFELFQDDDVLRLFDMEEPSDAALANHSRLASELGIVDQRLEAWFRPFSWTVPTGYLEPVEG